MRTEVAAGHRVFVVCPLVDGSERVQARSATAEMERLDETVLDRASASACSTVS